MAIDDNTSYELTGYQVKDLAQKIRAKADSNSLAPVATSNLYSDLTGTPTIPTVYNGTLTIQQNGTTLGTFSANQNTNETINITGGDEPIGFQWDGSDMKDADDNAATGADVSDAFVSSGAMITCYDLYGSYTDYASGIVIQGMQETNLAQTETFLVQFSDPTTGNVLHRKFHYDPTASPKWSVNDVTVQSKLTAGTNITIAGDTISATDTTYSDFTGATSSVAGAAGLVPAPAAGDEAKALHGDGTWKDTTAKLVEMSYGESNAWAKFIAAYNAGSIVYCRASSNANPASGSQTRKAFMAYVNNAASPTSVEFQYVRSVSSKTESQPVDQVFVYTLTNTSGGTWSVASRNMAPKIAAGTGINVSYSNGTYTISLAS